MPWSIDADYIIACSCDYGCPCNFNAPPSRQSEDGRRFCEGCSLLRINNGHYDSVDLKGRKCGYASRWSGPIYDGDGVVSFYIDKGANQQQRVALYEIISGQAGGTLFPALADLYSRPLPAPHFVDITIDGADENTRAVVDGRVKMQFERIRDKRTQAFAPRMLLEKWFSYQTGGVQYTLEEFWVKDDDAQLNFNHPGMCAQYTSVHDEGG
jgi:hypothetical protein